MNSPKQTYRNLPAPEIFKEEALKRVVEGDLFSYKNPVIPIKTKGRWYGALSQQVVKQGIVLPELSLCEARFVDPYIFVGLWSDDSPYSFDLIHDCAANCLRVASAQLRLELLAMPVLGGKEGFKWLYAAEQALFDEGDALEGIGFTVPKHVYVTDKTLT